VFVWKNEKGEILKVDSIVPLCEGDKGGWVDSTIEPPEPPFIRGVDTSLSKIYPSPNNVSTSISGHLIMSANQSL